MKDIILEQYEIRKSNPEKTRFIEYIKARLSAAGYDAQKDIVVEEKGKGLFLSRNIVVGNPKEAKIILGAHYDTCAMLPFPNFMSPTNPVLFIISQIVLVILMFAMALAVGLIAMLVTQDGAIAYVAFLVFLYVFLFHLLFGFRNNHTANDNTSGTITITRILEGVPEEVRSKVCVVYFDNEEKGLLGSEFFYKMHKNDVKGKLLINFDCVGDGKEILFLSKKDARKDQDYIRLLEVLRECESEHDVELLIRNMKPMMFASDQMHFAKGVGVCAVRKSPIGRYVARIHTPFDTKCREENITYLVYAMKKYLEEI